MAANTTTPASLYASGVVEKPVNFTRNTLAVVVPKANPAGIKSIYDLTKPGIKIDDAASSVPVGSYTVQVLNQMGLNAAGAGERRQPGDLRRERASSKVALGQVDAGFVYLSDYVIDPTHLTLIKVPAWAQPKITYSMAIVTKSPNQAAAQAWMDKILSPAGQAIFVKDGFLPLTAPVPTIAKLAPAKAQGGRDGRPSPARTSPARRRHDQGRPGQVQGRLGDEADVTVPAKAKTGTITVTNPSGNARRSKRVHRIA